MTGYGSYLRKRTAEYNERETNVLHDLNRTLHDSWGKEYYISWQEYLHYAGKCSSFLVSNICMLYEKRRKKDRREKERGAL